MSESTSGLGVTSESARPHYPRVGLLIDGEWIHDRTPLASIRNPSDESVLGEVPRATVEDLDRALNAAQKGFDIWRKRAPAERAALLHRASEILRGRIHQVASVITLEQGKPYPDARAEVLRAASFLDWDAEQTLRTYGRVVPSEPPIQQLVVKEPVGPVAAFTPWNVPLSSPSRKISGALAAGCSVIIKPATETPATACVFAQCFIDAGVPDGVINVVFGKASEVSTQLIGSNVIRMVTLTGSVAVGKELARLAALGVKPAIMELGGHAPVIIDEDVDAAKVAKLAASAKFRMAGQICASPTRFIAHRSVYRDFVDAFAREANALKVGDGFLDGVHMGPLMNERRVEEMATLVEDGARLGAAVAAGGRRAGERGYFYTPTILADVPLAASAMTVEPFGPLALCLPVKDMTEALAVANASDVGLSGYIFSNAIERVDHLWQELQCGVIACNSFGVSGAEAPFGGVKESGIGREGGEEGVHSYMITKTVLKSAVRI